MGQFAKSIHVAFHVGTLLALCAGCGSEMVPVRGLVEYEDGSPVDGAIRIIRFEPDDDTNASVRKVASGEIAEDGAFELMSLRPGDGVYKGKYVVTFTVLESPQTGVSLIKPKYSSFADSPFEVDVDGSTSEFVFKLEKLEN